MTKVQATTQQSVRWRPAVVIMVLAVITGCFRWFSNELNHQRQFMETAGVAVIGAIYAAPRPADATKAFLDALGRS